VNLNRPVGLSNQLAEPSRAYCAAAAAATTFSRLADTEHLGQLALGRQSAAGPERAVCEQFFEALHDQLSHANAVNRRDWATEMI
jgi:hypothetical protein